MKRTLSLLLLLLTCIISAAHADELYRCCSSYPQLTTTKNRGGIEWVPQGWASCAYIHDATKECGGSQPYKIYQEAGDACPAKVQKIDEKTYKFNYCKDEFLPHM